MKLLRKRIEEFKEYKENWDGKGAKTYSRQALKNLELFLPKLESAGINPSVFFDEQGYFSLLWEDSEDHEVEVEFSDDAITFIVESE